MILSGSDFKKIAEHVYTLISKNALTTTEILNDSPSFKKEHVWKVLEYLFAEKKLHSTIEGKIGIKN
jgi:hypothetical protein